METFCLKTQAKATSISAAFPRSSKNLSNTYRLNRETYLFTTRLPLSALAGGPSSNVLFNEGIAQA